MIVKMADDAVSSVRKNDEYEPTERDSLLGSGSEKPNYVQSASNDVSDSSTSTDTQEDHVQLTGIGGSLACDPRRWLHRYLVLIFMCLLSFGKSVYAN